LLRPDLEARNASRAVGTLRRGATANTTGGLESNGQGDPRPWKLGKPFRILVVEDHRDTADCLRLLLELSGYEVRVAHQRRRPGGG
jgi:hypothetical protein